MGQIGGDRGIYRSSCSDLSRTMEKPMQNELETKLKLRIPGAVGLFE